MTVGTTLILAAALAAAGTERPMLDHVHWLGHDGFRVDGPPVVYIDPYRISDGNPPADLILVTHGHSDHCSPDDIAKVRTARTIVVAPAEVAAKLAGTVHAITAGEELSLLGVRVRAVPAYNIDKRFHPKAAGGVGYLLTVAGITIYHAGDTDFVPEMAGLRPDVALLPVSGTYVMTAAEAATAAQAIGPKIAVPMHYGAIIGSPSDADRFAALLQGSPVEVAILPKE